MGNGYPVAGIAVRPGVVSDFGHDMRYFNTFGGNSVAMAAANATLEVVQGENLIENARQVGDILLSGLRDLMQGDERIGDVRGTGLYLAIEMVKNRKTREPDSPLALALVNEMRRRRVLISATAANANVLKIRPPLTFSADNADQFLTELAGALKPVN
jgi:4-aminobutyrate aminotransferase-like enzyme